MSTPQPARKRLPVQPSEENLRKQAKRRAKADDVSLADAQHRLAVEYGTRNWAELMRVVETMRRGSDQLENVKAKIEPLPAAVRARDVAKVRALLAAGGFTQHDLDKSLAHAAWYGGDAPSVLAVRKELFDLLLDHGADPDGQYGSAYGPIVFGTGECQSPEGLQWLIDAGCDVAFAPLQTKYGPVSPMSHWLGTYSRSADTTRKHRGIDLLLSHGALIPSEVTPPILAVHRGDAGELSKLLDADASLLNRRFADMPYGNMHLAGATLLHAAVELGEIACIDLLLDRHADINTKAEVIDGVGGQTPIYHAINTHCDGNFHTLQHLVQRVGPSLDMTVRATWRGGDWPILNFNHAIPRTPLEYAETAARDIDPQLAHLRPRREEEIALLRLLDGSPTPPAKPTPSDGPPTDQQTMDLFRTALRAGDAAAVRALLTGSVYLRERINQPLGDFGARPVHMASQFPDVMDVLQAFDADINLRSDWKAGPFSVLDSAPETAARHYVARGATLTAHAAARLGWIDELRALVDADPAVVHEKGGDGQRPLHFAKTPEIADLLLDRGADPDARCDDHHSTPAQYALAERPDVARRLLDRGAVPDLFMAARLGDTALAERLISADPSCLEARINARGYSPVPPFNIYCWSVGWYLSPHETAIKFNQLAAYDWLMERSETKVRLLVHAARGDSKAARGLIAAEPTLMSRLTPHDQKLLPYMMFYNRPATVELMLALGFDPAATGTDGGTLLHIAAWHGNASVVERLLRDHRHHIDLGQRDTTHKGTPLDWAVHGSTNSFVKDGDYGAVVRLLRAAGAKPSDWSGGSDAVREAMAAPPR